MNKTRKSLYRLLLGLFLVFVSFLAACGPRMGLDAVAQTGRWMSVLQPVQDAAPQLVVVDTLTGKPHLILTDADIYQQPITIYSPSGEYLLYRGTEMWRLVEISNQQMWDVAPTSMGVEFLSDDEILITHEQKGASTDGSQPKSVYQLSLVSPRSPGQENWRVITNQGRYIFKNQAQGLSVFLGSSLAGTPPAQAFCPPTSFLTWDTRVIVNSDRTVMVITSDAENMESNTRSPHKLSAATADLLLTYEALQEALALKQIQETPGYENMSEAEKAAMVDTIARSGITGLVSPDGEHLLILTATSIDTDVIKYSLNLINLETDQRIVLSSESNWTPAFLFSPDGSQILYESNDEGYRAWYLSSSDGSNRIRLPLQDVETLCWN